MTKKGKKVILFGVIGVIGLPVLAILIMTVVGLAGGVGGDGFCQSCGMPMQKDPQKGGYEAGGTAKSAKYCSYCYNDGEFYYKGTDVEGFQKLCSQKMVASGSSRFTAWFFTRGMGRLERWQQTKTTAAVNKTNEVNN
jgi:hypothetical protein